VNELTGFYTDRQREVIIREALAYDKACEEQLWAEANPVREDPHEEIRRILYPTPEERQEDILEEIRFAQDEVAELAKTRDEFFADDFIREYAAMLIRVWIYKIEDLQEELCR